MTRIRVGVFFGGRSTEHDVSVCSARYVIDNLDKNKYEIIPIGVDKKGNFHLMEFCGQSLEDILRSPVARFVDFFDKIDVAFPVLHGSFGEDGAIQGFFRTLDIPFVGPDVMGSSICMDKDVTKRLLKESGIPCARSRTIHRTEKVRYEDLKDLLGEILFVKPANLGSSVGVSKVSSKTEFDEAVKKAFLYDNKVLVEEFIKGQEVECSVLGNEYPMASIPGEIALKEGFYSYEAKYIDKTAAELRIPAHIPEKISDRIRSTATKAFKVLGCEGMARIDFFVKENGDVLLNEVNTIPGFTDISMYPKLWEATGKPYSVLLDDLIFLAIERHKRDGNLLL